MKHVVFHNDVEGIVSAALFLHNHVRDGAYRLYPLASTTRGPVFQKMIDDLKIQPNGFDKENFVAILDFEYHEKADMWVDHHFNQKFGDCIILNDTMSYNPKSKSAARLVHELPSKYKNYPTLFITITDMIDSCEYKNIDQIFHDYHPLMAIRAFIEQAFPSSMMLCRIVEMMVSCRFDLLRCNAQLGIGDASVDQIRNDAHKCEKEIVLFRSFSLLRQRRVNQFPRYSELYVYPHLKYWIRASQSGNGLLYLQIGFNKFQKANNAINIRTAIQSCKQFVIGGGHFNVGAGTVKESDLDDVLDYFDSLFNNEDNMEKYGVDKSDPIEQKAQEMMKTGEFKDIKEARKAALITKETVSDGTKV